MSDEKTATLDQASADIGADATVGLDDLAGQVAELSRATAKFAHETAERAGQLHEKIGSGLDQLAVAGGDVAASAAADPLIFQLSIFVLAIFVGYYVVWSVTPALHTPLMSVTNAISSVIIVGALLAVGVEVAGTEFGLARGFGFAALILASVNIFGGFLVTARMLAMYQKKR